MKIRDRDKGNWMNKSDALQAGNEADRKKIKERKKNHKGDLNSSEGCWVTEFTAECTP